MRQLGRCVTKKTKEAKELLQYDGYDKEDAALCDNCKYWLKKIGDTSSTGECTKNYMISRCDYRCGNWDSV